MGILIGLLGGIALLGNSLFSFVSTNEIFAAYPEILKPLIEERQQVLLSDTLRSLGFVVAIFVALGLWTRQIIKERIAFASVVLLLLLDLVGVNKEYVNADQFVPFHISTVNTVSKSGEGDWTYLRINFHTPSVGKSGALQFPDLTDPNVVFVKEVTFKNQDRKGENNHLRLAE